MGSLRGAPSRRATGGGGSRAGADIAPGASAGVKGAERPGARASGGGETEWRVASRPLVCNNFGRNREEFFPGPAPTKRRARPSPMARLRREEVAAARRDVLSVVVRPNPARTHAQTPPGTQRHRHPSSPSRTNENETPDARSPSPAPTPRSPRERRTAWTRCSTPVNASRPTRRRCVARSSTVRSESSRRTTKRIPPRIEKNTMPRKSRPSPRSRTSRRRVPPRNRTRPRTTTMTTRASAASRRRAARRGARTRTSRGARRRSRRNPRDCDR